MNRRSAWIATISAFVLSVAISTIGATENSAKRPDWCKPGFECIPTAEIVKDAEFHYDLQEQVLRYKRRAQRFGLTVGPGVGVGSVITSEYDVHWVGTTGMFIVWGLRF